MAGMIRKHGDDTAVVHLCGALTHAVFDRFAALLDHLDRSDARCFVVDMSEVDFIDSSGIGMLLMAQELAEHRECAYRLRGVTPVARAILEQARVNELFVLEPAPGGATPGGSDSAAA
ncbi:STAS domain-containing protein [Roseospira goensis]|uniref:Anti-anti-sigma factor n=1 Tax=Roseospira goensis TaxID=391922 RepID=A0A7W6S1D6_9PROT|nr:STAS domain-containing protein [Roseospira goensis]MBB4287108.1 anti-anti-sigma factor [Roseospira goensis]